MKVSQSEKLTNSDKLLRVLDKEDEEGVVEDNFEGFQKLYRPIWK